jgi:putative membrane protein
MEPRHSPSRWRLASRRRHERRAHGRKAAPRQERRSPQQFIKDAAVGGMAEVKLGELAEQNAHSDAVKSFGKRMRDDHSQANSELEDLAAQKNVTLPTDVDAKSKATYDRLSKLEGRRVRSRVHERDAAGPSPRRRRVPERGEVERSATCRPSRRRRLPTLQSHLEEAQQIASGREPRARRSPDAGRGLSADRPPRTRRRRRGP